MIPFVLAVASCTWSDVTDRVDALWPGPEEEKWMEVGWRLNLFQARQEASDTGKPLFLWMMNGHPTGCT